MCETHAERRATHRGRRAPDGQPSFWRSSTSTHAASRSSTTWSCSSGPPSARHDRPRRRSGRNRELRRRRVERARAQGDVNGGRWSQMGKPWISSPSRTKTFSSRLIVGTGKYSSPAVMVQAHEASGAEMITVAVRRVNISDRSKESLLDLHRHVEVLPAAEYRRLLHRRRSDPHGAARTRGRAVELGEARGDRRRADALPRQRSADRGDAHARARRLRRAAVHDRRSGRVPQARGRRRRGGHAARRADRLRARHPEREQHPHHPRVRARAADRRRRRRHRVGCGAGDGARRRRAC